MKRPSLRWLHWLRPSLARRVVLAILLAFGLVAVVLLAQSYVEFRNEFSAGQDSALTRAARNIALALERADNTHDALVIAHSLQVQSDAARRELKIDGVLLAEVRDGTGQRIYATPELGATVLDAPATGQRDQIIGARHYRVTQATAGIWQLRLGEPRLTDASALSLLGAELIPSLLIAFPFVVLPVWLAVRQGLRPLRLLSKRMAQRHGDDLTPLDVDLKYAELQPMVSAFNELLAKLRDKVQRERAFVQDAAHELRTPMAAIAAQAHVLTRAANEAERHQAEGALEQAIQRASHLAQQLLALASLDDSRPAAPQRIDLAHLLQNLLAQAMPMASQRQIELSLDAPDSLSIEADLPALQSVAQNLIDNALRYGRTGGQVAVTLQALPDHIVLTVADDGPGIPEAERPHIFDRFVRGAGHDAPGTGLGLAIVKQAAQRLRGSVQIASGLGGQGVAFVVRLPPPGTGRSDSV
jgi:two-component system sensor histidine kinase QseC